MADKFVDIVKFYIMCPNLKKLIEISYYDCDVYFDNQGLFDFDYLSFICECGDNHFIKFN